MFELLVWNYALARGVTLHTPVLQSDNIIWLDALAHVDEDHTANFEFVDRLLHVARNVHSTRGLLNLIKLLDPGVIQRLLS